LDALLEEVGIVDPVELRSPGEFDRQTSRRVCGSRPRRVLCQPWRQVPRAAHV